MLASWRDLFFFDDFINFEVRGGFEPVSFAILPSRIAFHVRSDSGEKTDIGLELVASVVLAVISLVVRKLLSW